MKKKQKEFATGVLIGLFLSLLLAVKVMAADVTPEEAEILAKVVYCEAENQDLQGKRLVVATVLNRTEHPDFPDNIEDVLSQKNQFATYSKLETTEATWQDRLAVKMETETRSNEDVLFFRTTHYGTGTPLFKYQDHYFSGLADDEN